MVKAYLQRDKMTDAADVVVMHVGEATPEGTIPLDRVIERLTIERRGADLGAEHDIVQTTHRGAIETVAAARSDLELSDDALVVRALDAMFGLTVGTGGLGGWTAVLLPPYDLAAYHAELARVARRSVSTSTAEPVAVIEEE